MEVGDKFGFWTVVDTTTATRANEYMILSKCICGDTKTTRKKYLLNGKSKSCGCGGFYVGYSDDEYKVLAIYQKKYAYADFLCLSCGEISNKRVAGRKPRNPCQCKVDRGSNRRIHGESPMPVRTKEYNIWRAMRQRCNSPTTRFYKYYGGRGIKVCDRWSDYNNFISDMGRAGDRGSIDRIDVNGNYEPSNCRWATARDQVINRRITIKLTFDGVEDFLPYWADASGISTNRLYQRYRKYGDCGNKELMLRKGQKH